MISYSCAVAHWYCWYYFNIVCLFLSWVQEIAKISYSIFSTENYINYGHFEKGRFSERFLQETHYKGTFGYQGTFCEVNVLRLSKKKDLGILFKNRIGALYFTPTL